MKILRSVLKIIFITHNTYLKNKPYQPSGTFQGLPENGIFIWKKGVNCNELLKQLPVSWNRSQE